MALLKRRKNEELTKNPTTGDLSQQVIIGKAGRFDRVTKLVNKRLLIILSGVLIAGGGLYYAYINDWLGPLSPARNTEPKPGDQIGPAPVEEKIPDFVPTDIIQVVPDGDGPDIPHEENKPASAG